MQAHTVVHPMDFQHHKSSKPKENFPFCEKKLLNTCDSQVILDLKVVKTVVRILREVYKCHSGFFGRFFRVNSGGDGNEVGFDGFRVVDFCNNF